MKLNTKLILPCFTIQSIVSVFTPSKEDLDAFVRASRSQHKPPVSGYTNVPPGVVNSKMGPEEGARFLFNAAGLSYCPKSKIEAYDGVYSKRLSRGFKILKVFEDESFETQNYIADFEKRKELIIVFRGSVNQNNWELNFDVNQVPLDSRSHILVHSGFKRITDSMAPVTIEYLKELYNQPKYRDYTLVVAGHSLGGALATLSLIRYQEALQLPWNRTHLFTYGSPRVGNKHFVNWVNSNPMESTRVVNEGDLVPVLPERYYTHIHTELYIKGGQSIICETTSYEDPQCSTGAVSSMGGEAHNSAWGMTLDDRYCY